MANTYKIGELAKASGLTIRTIRYYDELGLLKTRERTKGGQRLYSDSDLLYLKRIKELKELDFSLEEIKEIILKGEEDKSGEIRRALLLKQYKEKLAACASRIEKLEALEAELKWHIAQLETAGDSFQECPGRLCASCAYATYCSFKEG